MNSNRNKIILKCKGLKYKMTELSDVKNKLNVFAVYIELIITSFYTLKF